MLQDPTPTPDNASHLLRGPKHVVPRTANGEATQKIIVAARQANELLMRQAMIDAEVKERYVFSLLDPQPIGLHPLRACVCQ